jgi:hypothetical protein
LLLAQTIIKAVDLFQSHQQAERKHQKPSRSGAAVAPKPMKPDGGYRDYRENQNQIEPKHRPHPDRRVSMLSPQT